jgi:hypothetical protein
MKQTAVDFAVEQLEKLIPSGNQILIGIILEKAKEMEKEQIEDAYDSGQVLGFYLGSINEDETDQTGEIFYQEKYK